jgi:threonine dehydratase
MSELPSRSDVVQARNIVQTHVRKTPIMTCGTLDRQIGASIAFKSEHLQTTGSFKVRGALNYIRNATPESLAHGVVTVSAGNHAQAVAWAGGAAGVKSIVVMPESAPAAKVAASRGYGAEVRLAPDAALAFAEARRIAEDEGPLFLHPFDHPWIVAGQGTVGLELEEQVPDLDAVIVPVGGGGLISGVLTALCEAHPSLAVYGVEPEGAAGMSESLAAGRAVTLTEPPHSIADGLAPPMAGELNYAIVRRYAKDVVRVTEDEIREAFSMILSRAKAVVEPAAAAAYAGLLSGRIILPPGARVAVILSGGNVSLSDIPSLLPQEPLRTR